MLEIQSLSLSFGGIRALSDVTFDVPDGPCFGLIGPNGAGKTALLNCVSGVYRPREGAVRLNGESITGMRPSQISRLGIGRTFQSMDHFEEFRVADYVLLGRVGMMPRSAALAALRWPPAVRQERAQRKLADATLEMCGLSAYGHAVLSEIPYGVQKLVDVARVLCSDADWVLLDEPTSGTTSEDRPAISAAVDLLVDHGATVVIVDHDVDFVARHAVSLVALDQGKVIAQGPTRTVLSDPLVRRIYFGLVREEQVEAAAQVVADHSN
ncbi:MAG: ABC transporter ATP-binding protein [Candidatus Dormibacteria bacterium]